MPGRRSIDMDYSKLYSDSTFPALLSPIIHGIRGASEWPEAHSIPARLRRRKQAPSESTAPAKRGLAPSVCTYQATARSEDHRR